MQKQNTDGAGVIPINGSIDMRIIKHKEILESVIGKIEQGKNYYFVTGGRWSSHDLMSYLLDITGPCKVYLSTWAISEDAARLLLKNIQKNIIKELYVILDRRVRIRKPKVLQLAQSIATKISLVECHAKVFALESDTWNITVSGSANMSNNKRIETGMIFTEVSVMDFNKNWILQQVNNGDPFGWKGVRS